MAVAACHLAVQDDPASFCMDWPVFETRTPESCFRGEVFVLDPAGVRVADAAMRAGGDLAADEALRGLGWTRSGEWRRDEFGRRIARVRAGVDADREAGPLPAHSIASLAEEASLHLA